MPHLNRILDTNGDGTGTKNAIGNYSDAALGETSFFIQPAANQGLKLARLLVMVRDNQGIASGEYGSGSALTNGVIVRLTKNGRVITDWTDGVPVKNNAGWSRLAGPDSVPQSYGTGDDFLSVRFTMSKSGAPVQLWGAQWKFEVVLNDNFSSLVEHYFIVQGTSVTAPIT